MRLNSFHKILSALYSDRMDITKVVKSRNSDGTTKVYRESVPSVTDVPCRISYLSEESPKDKQVDSNPVNTYPKVFCALSENVAVGDLVTVRRISDDGEVLATYTGYAGAPSYYPSHKEFLLAVEENA